MENNKIIYFEQLDSTNTKLHEIASQGAEHGTVVVARSQTGGKGRRGRIWESPEGDNIYMSILLRPEFETAKASILTLVMAYSVSKVMRSQGFANLQIKWPNDIILSGKKVCGILTELRTKCLDIDYIIIGVGMNVNASSFTSKISETATSLFLETGKRYDNERLIKDIVCTFNEEYERFVKTGDISYLQDEYNEMLVNCGKEVRILEPQQEYVAIAEGINSSGELLVRMENGEEKKVYAGEVSVRGVYGYI